mgnify:CR=1 FL=1
MSNKNNNAMRYAGLGAQMMATLAAATWLGWYIDEKTTWNFPLFIIILPLLALVYSLWKLIKALEKPDK